MLASTLCSWKKSRRQAEPTQLKNIIFKRPKKNDRLPNLEKKQENIVKCYSCYDPTLHDGHERQKFTKLFQVAPKAAIFKSLSYDFTNNNSIMNRDTSETDTDDETETNSLPEPLTSIFDSSSINLTYDELINKSTKYYKEYIQSTYEHQLENLCEITKKQKLSDKWNVHRSGRITASISKMAYSTKLEAPSRTFIQTVMQYFEPVKVAATTYGTKMENAARRAYFNLMNKHHIDFQVLETGLHIDPNNLCLGASPDGISYCKCHGIGILEIKCPYKYKQGLAKWFSDSNCPIDNK